MVGHPDMTACSRPAGLLMGLILALAGCTVTPVSTPPTFDETTPRQPALSPDAFLSVASRIEPVAEALCRSETPDQDCDFAILVDRDPRNGANAFQTVTRDGRPIVILTLGLVAILENEDELAFVLGHEAGHHIGRHLPMQRGAAEEGARIFGELAAEGGADAGTIARASQIGAFVGARRYSQEAELEADILGTAIALSAGYDPVAGALLFQRLPEPTTQFLATHPPNALRMQTVRRTVRQIRAGG